MCFAGAVYSFQAGWVQKHEKAAAQVSSTKSQLDDAIKQKDDQTEKFTADLLKEKTRADIAEAKEAGLNQNLKQAIGNQGNAEKERDKHLADLLVAQKEAQARVTETNDARAEIKRLRDQNNDAIAIRRGLEDKNLQMEGQLAEASSRESQFLKEITRLNDLLRLNKIDPRDPVIGPVPRLIEPVDGKVEDSRKNASRSQENVLISVGSDDGVFKGLKMTVYRTSDDGNANYLATIKITDVYPDKAVGLVLEETRNGTIERDDYVTTKFGSNNL